MPRTEKTDPAEAALYERISSSLDRLREAHFWLHGIEQYYHFAEAFRWHLNSFLKALKEVLQLLSMELQQAKGFKQWFVPKRTVLHSDPLLKVLHDHRDFVVHRGMLIPKSIAMIGVTEGRGMKLGITFPVHPLENSDDGMRRYIAAIKVNGDFLGTLIDDEDSLPCVERHWRLPDFDEEVVELCARAWLRVGETVGEVLTWLGASPPSLSLDCRHASQELHYRLYERATLREWMADMAPPTVDQ
jgi:hypothetical protein